MIYYFGIGTNLGRREENIQNAIIGIRRDVGDILAQSQIYWSMPQGFDSKNEFANIVVKVCSKLSPMDVLHLTQTIERAMGREEKSRNGIYTDRIIDIDLIMAFTDAGEQVHCHTDELSLPHPRMQEREFVMMPLAELNAL